jgi:hypothetical protein
VAPERLASFHKLAHERQRLAQARKTKPKKRKPGPPKSDDH